jgi:hypothetical protein
MLYHDEAFEKKPVFFLQKYFKTHPYSNVIQTFCQEGPRPTRFRGQGGLGGKEMIEDGEGTSVVSLIFTI